MRPPFTLPAGTAVTASRVTVVRPSGGYGYAYAYVVSVPGPLGVRPLAYVEPGPTENGVRRYYVSRYRAAPRTGYVNLGYSLTAVGVGVALGVLAANPTYPAASRALSKALRGLR